MRRRTVCQCSRFRSHIHESRIVTRESVGGGPEKSFRSNQNCRRGWKTSLEIFKKRPGPIRCCRAKMKENCKILFHFLPYDVAQKPCKSKENQGKSLVGTSEMATQTGKAHHSAPGEKKRKYTTKTHQILVVLRKERK